MRRLSNATPLTVMAAICPVLDSGTSVGQQTLHNPTEPRIGEGVL